MDPTAFVESFRNWRAKHRRTAYLPRLGQGGGRSRFGGEPEMPPGEPWPICSRCRAPMLFLLQIDMSSLPERSGDGLLQLFCCNGADCETWEPFSGTQLARLSIGALERRPLPTAVAPQPERSILGWDAIDDYPNAQDHESLGIHCDYDFDRSTVRIRCPEIGFDRGDLDLDAYSAESIASADARDKLFGWPRWVQRAEYPKCSQCGARMDLLLQIQSEGAVDLALGDNGIGHITQCPDHRHVFAFGWASS